MSKTDFATSLAAIREAHADIANLYIDAAHAALATRNVFLISSLVEQSKVEVRRIRKIEDLEAEWKGT